MKKPFKKIFTTRAGVDIEAGRAKDPPAAGNWEPRVFIDLSPNTYAELDEKECKKILKAWAHVFPRLLKGKS